MLCPDFLNPLGGLFLVPVGIQAVGCPLVPFRVKGLDVVLGLGVDGHGKMGLEVGDNEPAHVPVPGLHQAPGGRGTAHPEGKVGEGSLEVFQLGAVGLYRCGTVQLGNHFQGGREGKVVSSCDTLTFWV